MLILQKLHVAVSVNCVLVFLNLPFGSEKSGEKCGAAATWIERGRLKAVAEEKELGKRHPLSVSVLQNKAT